MTTIHSLDYSVARTDAEREEVYRLRYSCYRRTGAIPPNTNESFRDSFDELPNHFSFLLRDVAAEIAATVRISVVRPDLGWTDSPVSHVYADDPQFQSVARESYVEASRLCFGDQARRGAFVSLVAHMAALAEFYDVQWLIACPRVEHAHVYQRLFGFRPMAEARQYFGVSFETQLLGIRATELRAFVANSRLMTSAVTQAAVRFVQTKPQRGGISISARSGK